MIKVITNPDKDFVKEVRARIKENNGHCACAIKFDDANICMCEEFKQQIKEGKTGECHCNLYIAVEE